MALLRRCCVGAPFVVTFVKPGTFPLCVVDVSMDAPELSWDAKPSCSPSKQVAYERHFSCTQCLLSFLNFGQKSGGDLADVSCHR